MNAYLKVGITVLFINFSVSPLFAEPTNGMSRADLIAELGEPRGVGGNSKFEMLSFGNGVIELTQGKVSHIPEGFGKQTPKIDSKGFAKLWEKIRKLFPTKEVEPQDKPSDVYDELAPIEEKISPEAQALMDKQGMPPAVDTNQKAEVVNPDEQTGQDQQVKVNDRKQSL